MVEDLRVIEMGLHGDGVGELDNYSCLFSYKLKTYIPLISFTLNSKKVFLSLTFRMTLASTWGSSC